MFNKRNILFLGLVVLCLCGFMFNKTSSNAAKKYAITIKVKDKKDFRRSMQAALDKAAKKGTSAKPALITIPNGTYHLKGTLLIGSNTIVKCGKKTKIIKTTSDFSYLIRSQLKKKGKYNSIKNVTIDGGTWDSNYKKHSAIEGGSTMTFVHGQNITIKNATLCHNYSAHLIEFVGIKGGTVDKCKLYGFIPYNDEAKKEAIQLDIVHSTKTISKAAPYDDTICRDIKITNNVIHDYARAFGTHSAVDQLYQDNILVENNKIYNLTAEALYCYNFTNVTINKNNIYNVAKALMIKTDKNDNGAAYYYRKAGTKAVKLADDAFNYTITNNIMLAKQMKSYSSVCIGLQIYGSSRYIIGGINISNNKISGTYFDLYIKYTRNVTVANNNFVHHLYRANDSYNVIFDNNN